MDSHELVQNGNPRCRAAIQAYLEKHDSQFLQSFDVNKASWPSSSSFML